MPVGSISTLAIAFAAESNLRSDWVTPSGRFLTTVAETGLMFFFALSILLIILGLALMAVELFAKEK